jgi:hypothetical protein
MGPSARGITDPVIDDPDITNIVNNDPRIADLVIADAGIADLVKPKPFITQ